MKTKARHKPSAANDNKPVKARRGGRKLRSLQHERKPSLVLRPSAKSQAKATLRTTPNVDINDAGYRESKAEDRALIVIEQPSSAPAEQTKIQAVFLLILGFALTCIATLAYVLVTGEHRSLLHILIPATMISGVFLVAMRSTAALWVGLGALTIWSGLGAVAKYNGEAVPASEWLIALPIVLSLFIIAANQSRSRNLMLASLACAYFWLAIFTLGSDLSALASGTLVFILGTAHHRLGKAWGDMGARYAHQHTLIGWVAAMLGITWAQHYYITLGALIPTTIGLGAHESFYWLLGMTLGLTVIVISSLIRMRYNRLSFSGFMGILTGCIILPLIAYNPALLDIAFERFSDLPATPYFGFSLGAVVMSFAVGVGMNGLRRRRYVDVIIAGLAICVQFAIIMNPYYLNFDTFIVVLFTMMFVMCFDLMLARRSIITSPLHQTG